jgi:RNA polymerase sigma factor (sigma-70 family)
MTATVATDWKLLRQYVEVRDNAAMCALVARHSGMVHAAALRQLGDMALADDVTQAVFVVLLRKAESISERTAATGLGGWLFKVTQYAVLDVRKMRKRRQHHEQEAARMIASPPLSADSPMEDLEPHLHDAIARLSAADRNAIVLRYLEGHAIGDVAIALGTSENSARQRVFRAVARLRKYFLDAGVPTTVAALTTRLEAVTAPSVSPALIAQLEGLIGGAAPAASAQAIVIGVLHMLTRTAQLTMMTWIGATAGVVLTAGIAITVLKAAPDTKPTAATAPAVTTAVSGVVTLAKTPPNVKLGPQSTPKGTIMAAWQAAQAGDNENFLNCFADLPDDKKEGMKPIVRIFASTHALEVAVADKFGVEAATQLLEPMHLGVDGKIVQECKETIDGNTAVVDFGPNSGPGKVDMVKVGDVWKLNGATLSMPNDQGTQQLDRLTPQLNLIAAKVKAGEVKSVKELQAAMMGIMSPQPQPMQLP